MLLITRTVLVSTGGRQPQKTVLEKTTDQNYTLLKIMARQTGSQRRKARATRTETNKKNRATKIKSEIARIEAGGKTTWKSKDDALSSLKNKLTKSGGTTTNKKSNLKISKGAAAAQEMARKRIAEGRNTVTGELKKPKKSNGSSTTFKAKGGQGNKGRGSTNNTTKPKKRKRIQSELWD